MWRPSSGSPSSARPSAGVRENSSTGKAFGITSSLASRNRLLSRHRAASHVLTATKVMPAREYASALRSWRRRDRSRLRAGRSISGQRPQASRKRVHSPAWWHRPVAHHMSCIVHTTGLPVAAMRSTPRSDSMPWFTQLRHTTSASRTHGCRSKARRHHGSTAERVAMVYEYDFHRRKGLGSGICSKRTTAAT